MVNTNLRCVTSRKKKKKSTPEKESFVIASGQTWRHKVTARAHFLLRGLFSESTFLSSESLLPPRVDREAAWLFSAVSDGSLGFLVLWSTEAGLGFFPPEAQEKTALMRKMPTKVANSVESTRDPERPLTCPRMWLRIWHTGVSELGCFGNFSCVQTNTFQRSFVVNVKTQLAFPMHITVNDSCLSCTLPLVQTPQAVSQASDHQGSQWGKTPLCTSASTKPADGSFQNNKQKYSKPESGFRLVCGFLNVYYFYLSPENYYGTMETYENSETTI